MVAGAVLRPNGWLRLSDKDDDEAEIELRRNGSWEEWPDTIDDDDGMPGHRDDEEDEPPASSSSSLLLKASLVVMVVILGCANSVAKQVVAKVLGRFDYMLGLVMASAYLVFYWAILGTLLALGLVEGAARQIRWVWCPERRGRRSSSPGGPGCCSVLCDRSPAARPGLRLLAVTAFGDALGDVVLYLCTPYVAGPVQGLVAQCTAAFVAILSLVFLGRRYSLMQSTTLLVAMAATTLGIIPSLKNHGANGTDPVMALMLVGSCFFTSVSFVTKEVAFAGYERWASEAASSAQHGQRRGSAGGAAKPAEAESLNIFVANTAGSTLQLPLTLAFVPLAVATGQTHGDPLPLYLSEGWSCLVGSANSCGPAPLCAGVYVLINLAWNICILLSIKWNGALATFVALKAVMPLAALLFAYVDWPLLGRTPVPDATWASLALVLPAVAAFSWASFQQNKREASGEATSCWPLCRPDDDDDDYEKVDGDSSDNADESGEERVGGE